MSSEVHRSVKLSKVVCYVTCEGHNHRNPFQNLGAEEVLFRPELVSVPEGSELPPDQRAVLAELVYGPEATDATKEDFVNRIKRSEPDLWAMAQNMLVEGQLDDIKVVAVDGGYGLIDGARRFIAKTVANQIAPDIVDDSIAVKLYENVEEAKLNSKAISSNIHRKPVSPVELGKTAAGMKKSGLSYKEIARTLNIYSDAKGSKAPEPNQQQVRNFALLWDAKVTDEDREGILNGTKAYTKVLQSRGLMKTTSATAGVESSGEGRTKVRKRSKNISELLAIFDSKEACDKIVDAMAEKGIEDPAEQVRYCLMKAANARYKAFPEPKEEETPEADEAA